jgi:SagB-type dehydrogenase family enzyme
VTAQQYHDGSKHHFTRFALSLGYLDWASQPNPFRSFGAQGIPLSLRQERRPERRGDPPVASHAGEASAIAIGQGITYDRLFGPNVRPPPVSLSAIADVLRHAMGLSAWKRMGDSRWALRVNPSSGNLHPTEAYVVVAPLACVADTPAVYHYAPDRHALELRCRFDRDAWVAACGDPSAVWLVALTSIHWRESWKYGERAFRYCQHDIGHAIAAVRVAAALAGWRVRMLSEWSHRTIATLTGIDRDEDFVEAEREEPACVLAVTAGPPPRSLGDGCPLADAIRRGRWSGRANQLSEDHVDWTFIDEIARATADPGRASPDASTGAARPERGAPPIPTAQAAPNTPAPDRGLDARALILQRRSALAFDGSSSTRAGRFEALLSRVMPGPHAPWDALWWTPRVHLALFVHRVEGLNPGLYALVRAPDALTPLKAACRDEFSWERASDRIPLFLLARCDCRSLARRLSCDQDIAADGFFSLGMIAEFDASLREHGQSFYRHLFWETGFVGQILYLEAEAAGARATGIGCFYDDPVHDVLGLNGHAFQSLYHFTVGVPVEDRRLTTEAPYRVTME